MASLRDLPEIERLEDEGLLQRPQPEDVIDGVLGLYEGDGQEESEEESTFKNAELDDAADGHQSANTRF